MPVPVDDAAATALIRVSIYTGLTQRRAEGHDIAGPPPRRAGLGLGRGRVKLRSTGAWVACRVNRSVPGSRLTRGTGLSPVAASRSGWPH